MLAPAVMISACGLLLLGINNKYSLVVNRIRLLNGERREKKALVAKDKNTTEDNVRQESVNIQIELLLHRVKLVRNAVLSYAIAVAMFVITSFLLGLAFFSGSSGFHLIIVITFLIGMIFVLSGVIFTGFETYEGYKIVNYEVAVDE
ncbi:MAG: DUF2721 domain-containing protein [Melioribacteraceae bacterium]|nr:DUF2721 domain-containing protein [Melioribacteraceae bacterium]MCF8263908.1 DUF2721 domain-containing protein [Melioribacteraceae bacterium]MCF8430313.1 DUF2721 domain-containing protein [Melioribacteraceae bacterium]